MSMPITIDVVHDTVCPWCRIGKRHLDDAIANWEGEAPLVRWHPFFLNPSMPAGGVDFRGYMASIKGDDNVEPMILAVTRAGTQAGLTFNWDRVRKAPEHAALPRADPRRPAGQAERRRRRPAPGVLRARRGHRQPGAARARSR
jgi:predicted DsbA family dithiol-disulfide isomerase